VPAIFDQILTQVDKSGKKSAAFDAVVSQFSQYQEIIKSFAHSLDEQQTIIQLVGLFCANNPFFADIISQIC
jgi:hypothetical protein